MVAIEIPAQPDAIELGTGPMPGATTPETWHSQYGSKFARNVTVATLRPFLPDPFVQRERLVPVVVAPAVEGRLTCGGHGSARNPEQTRSIRPTRPSYTEQTTVWVSTRGSLSGSSVSL